MGKKNSITLGYIDKDPEIVTCPHCNKEVPVRAQITGGINIDVRITSVSCPLCKGKIPLSKEFVHYDENGLATILSGAEFTPAVLTKLKDVTEQAKVNHYTPDQYRAEAVKISPAVAQLFTSTQFIDKFWKLAESPATGNFLNLLSFLIAAISLAIALKDRRKGSSKIDNIKRKKGYKSNYTPPKKKRK